MAIEGTLGTLRGIIHRPRNKPKGLFILLHGYFSSNKLGPSNLYVQIAREFSDQGFEFWRFDSYGVGDSDGTFAESSYSLRLKDYILITEEALKYSHNVNYIGHSLGSNFAINLANLYRKNVEKIILLAPTFGSITGISRLFSERQLSELDSIGYTNRQGIVIKKDFLDEITSEEIYQSIKKTQASIILIYGTYDDFYNKESIEIAISYMRSCNYLQIDSADHNFLYHKSQLLGLLKDCLAT